MLRDPAELEALLRLRALPGLGDRALERLLERHGSARRALAAPAPELGEAAAAARGGGEVRARVDAALRAIDRLGLLVLPRGHARYPAGLLELHDPPTLLFVRGRAELLERRAVAIVGTRRHTAYGAAAARAVAGGIARAGVVVVSGMARGIDAEAHGAALEVGGATVGVLGCGVDVAYPRRHAALYARVAAEGALVSEFLPGEPALKHNFPRRNRIIAALAHGVLVVEAPERSGALITVEHALDLGRDVFAVPGPIDRETSAGTNALIRDGARLVASAGDVLAELGVPLPDPPGISGEVVPPGLAGAARALWEALDAEPRHVDELAAACGLAAGGALAALLELELAGHARQRAGLRFVRG